MWQCILFFLCCVASLVTTQSISAQCERLNGHPNFPETSLAEIPSKVAGLKMNLVTVGIERKLNVSWAINIDASIKYLNGTWIIIDSVSTYFCKYNFTNPTGSTQEWFYLLEDVTYGGYTTDVFNVPLPPLGSGDSKLSAQVWVPRQKDTTTTAAVVATGTPYVTTGQQQTPTVAQIAAKEIKDVTAIVVGVMASLIILSSCFVIYKMCVSYPGFEIIPSTVSVVVVYPAGTPAFQRAVVSLAEFLQWHGGCRVAIDLWQQEKIAKLGPLRWLAEQVKNADRVLIISPNGENPPSMLVQPTPIKKLPEYSIPAAADDLYPLILNMVASHAKSPSELAKYWVVQLHADKDKKSCVLLPELQTCRAFYLMKDLKTLCNSLHAPSKIGKRFTSLLLKPKIFYTQNSTAKLREAIQMLSTNKPGIYDHKVLGSHL